MSAGPLVSDVPSNPVATAIVLNYNGKGFVEEAVESLLQQDLPGLEVIVVDNGSTDGSGEDVARRFGERVRFIPTGVNLGFGGGNNVGIRQAQGRHIILLNNDAAAAPAFARELVAAADADPRCGMVAAKVLDHERHDVLDTAGHLLYPDGLNRGRGRGEKDDGQYDGCATALFPSGAAALYRREMLDEVGLFDEAFYLYGDDAELGLRARLAGWRCAFAPRAVARHRYSKSAGAYSSLKAYYVERNRVWVLVRVFPFRLVVTSPLYTAGRFLLHAWGAATGRGAAARLVRERSLLHLVGVTLKAWLSAASGLPRMLSERWRSRGLRRLTTREFLDLLSEFRLTAAEAALKD